MISDKIYQSYDLSNLDPFENNIISEFEKFGDSELITINLEAK